MLFKTIILLEPCKRTLKNGCAASPPHAVQVCFIFGSFLATKEQRMAEVAQSPIGGKAESHYESLLHATARIPVFRTQTTDVAQRTDVGSFDEGFAINPQHNIM